MKLELKKPIKENVTMQEMLVGDIGILKSGVHREEIILKTFSGVVSLTDPNNTWDSPVPSASSVEILPKGTILTITV